MIKIAAFGQATAGILPEALRGLQAFSYGEESQVCRARVEILRLNRTTITTVKLVQGMAFAGQRGGTRSAGG